MNTCRWEWTTIAALIAPRPMLFANSDADSIFPMDGNRRIIARLRQAYRLYGKPDLVDDFVSKGGHDYRPDLRLAVFRWFDRHLMGVTRDVKDADDKPLPGKQLRVFPDDRDLPKDALNARIDETFVPIACVSLPAEKDFPGWKKGLLARLRQQSFRTFPDRATAAEVAETITPKRDRPRDPGVVLSTEGPARAFLSDPVQRGKKGTRSGTLIVLDEADEPGPAVPAWAKPHVGDGEVALLRPRGTGPTRWTRKSPPNYVERAHLLLGRTVDAGRVYDVAAVARRQAARADRPTWTVVGRGAAGVLAAYAALFEPSIAAVVVIDPPASHRDGPHFPGVQRVLDVPVALGLLAPLPLTLVGTRDRAFDTTTEIYRRAGAAAKLMRK